MAAAGFLPILIAIPAAAAGTWLLAKLAHRLGAVARVAPDRWHQTGAVPRLAGPALLLATAPWQEPGDLAVLGLVCAIGSWDDIRPMSPAVKALCLLAAAGLAIGVTGLWWAGPALWLVANALNLLDHADGVAAATAAAAFLGLNGDPGLAAAGACAGFLLFNYPPARAFMGDSGSLTLGAMIVMLGAKPGGLGTIAAWCAIPLADAIRVTLCRIARGQKPWVGGTDHSGHILLRAGIPPRLLPLGYFLVAGAVGLLLRPE
ncbi:UDP-N-acetylmuramyl pentapeptide phosphotransferase [Paramagnetospirillum magneticum]|uniref:UDP-N-acetylmuramyl pentapeptide phosphotransferase n=1 Tax=Paramagnetospirillum magneticum TaxID=84159 RepID=UPI0005C24F67|nr:UDP-N-acetylmuramyl pentapeptide phosphotransferase [Paramagnetospirillum magneticum]